jgi:hypothetical protein
MAYINTPELLDRVERNDFLEQFRPVVALCVLVDPHSPQGVLPHTLPLGGLVNHSVHVFMRGCLTLKFSGSWNTVRTSPSAGSLLDDFSLSPDSPVGEMGIVSSGTCWSGLGAVATSAIVNMWGFYGRVRVLWIAKLSRKRCVLAVV